MALRSRAERGPVPGPDGPASDALLELGRFFTRWEESDDGRAAFLKGGRAGDVFYRDRWSHDKVVRSTHGVNCTGSCSWKVYVQDGIITWEAQQTDYPSVGPDRPEYEPRGCPRGAAFSWYTSSTTRVRFPYVRGVLLEMYRDAKARLDDPVLAFAEITTDPEKRRRYQSARGHGGLVRASWSEAVEIVAAGYVNTIKTYGPDRVSGFSPIPAMSMVSHCVGTRFTQLVGGVMTSFYDWHADLPVASPQVFGDQTDVPESGDWWNSSYLMMWGSNVPVTRTPDAHWMAEGRYRGTKVIVISPDYADNTTFVDEWLPAQAGTDAALAMAIGHVILTEFFARRRVPFFGDYVRQYTNLPFLVTLTEHDPTPAAPRGGLVPGKFVTAADLGRPSQRTPGRPCCRTPPPDGPWCPTVRSASGTPTPVSAGGTSTWRGRAGRHGHRHRRRRRWLGGYFPPLVMGGRTTRPPTATPWGSRCCAPPRRSPWSSLCSLVGDLASVTRPPEQRLPSQTADNGEDRARLTRTIFPKITSTLGGRTVRIGLIGAGAVADFHARAAASIPGVALTAVCDLIPSAAERAAAGSNAAVFTDHRALLDSGLVDAVIVNTPHSLHARMTIEAAHRSLHVLVEKPMATTLADCDAMIAAAASSGVTLGVGHIQHFLPDKQALAAVLESGELGRVVLVHDYRTIDYRPSVRSPWFFDPAIAGGGALLNVGAHCLDRAMWFSGALADTVSASLAYRYGLPVETDALVSLKHAGVATSISVVSDAPGETDEVTVVCERGVLITDPRRGARLHQDGRDRLLRPPSDQALPEAFRAQLVDFVAAVHGAIPRVSVRHSRHVIELVLAAYRSAESGGAAVPVDRESASSPRPAAEPGLIP